MHQYSQFKDIAHACICHQKRVTEINTVIYQVSFLTQRDTWKRQKSFSHCDLLYNRNRSVPKEHITYKANPPKEKIGPLSTCSLEEADRLRKIDGAAKSQMLLALPFLNQKSHYQGQDKQSTQCPNTSSLYLQYYEASL